MIPTLDPSKYMTDAQGRLVPVDLVKPEDLLEDQLVRKMMKHADELSAQIGRFLGHCNDDIHAFGALLAEKYKAKKVGKNGSVTFRSFDGLLEVVVDVQDRHDYGPSLQTAKDLIDECIADWSEGSRVEIAGLVQHAFRVDRRGKINKAAIASLKKYKCDDPRWASAMEAIADAERYIGSKSYMRFYRRTERGAERKLIPIDLASAEPPAARPEAA